MSKNLANLKEETIEILKEHNKTLEDIEWVGTRDYRIPHDKDLNILDFDYDTGGIVLGEDVVATDLIIVGEDFWLERDGDWDYDQSWWVFKEIPKKPDEIRKNYDRFVFNGWCSTLEEINTDSDWYMSDEYEKSFQEKQNE